MNNNLNLNSQELLVPTATMYTEHFIVEFGYPLSTIPYAYVFLPSNEKYTHKPGFLSTESLESNNLIPSEQALCVGKVYFIHNFSDFKTKIYRLNLPENIDFSESFIEISAAALDAIKYPESFAI